MYRHLAIHLDCLLTHVPNHDPVTQVRIDSLGRVPHDIPGLSPDLSARLVQAVGLQELIVAALVDTSRAAFCPLEGTRRPPSALSNVTVRILVRHAAIRVVRALEAAASRRPVLVSSIGINAKTRFGAIDLLGLDRCAGVLAASRKRCIVETTRCLGFKIFNVVLAVEDKNLAQNRGILGV